MGFKLVRTGKTSDIEVGHSEPECSDLPAKSKGSEYMTSLLSWASELAEQDLVLSHPVSYIEAPLRIINTQRVSFCAARHLKTIAFAKLNMKDGDWGYWTSDWWRDRINESLSALAALREALHDYEDVDHIS